jgi:hypothetical protein
MGRGIATPADLVESVLQAARMVSERPLLRSQRPASGSFPTERWTGSPLQGIAAVNSERTDSVGLR